MCIIPVQSFNHCLSSSPITHVHAPFFFQSTLSTELAHCPIANMRLLLLLLLLPVWLALTGLVVGQRYRHWSDVSCTARLHCQEITPEAQGIACGALASMKTLTDPGRSVPDSDEPLYGSSFVSPQRFGQNALKTPSPRMEVGDTTSHASSAAAPFLPGG